MSCFRSLALNIYIGKRVKVRCPVQYTINHIRQTYEIGTILCVDHNIIHVQFCKPINSIFTLLNTHAPYNVLYGATNKTLCNAYIYEITPDHIIIYDHIDGNPSWNIKQLFRHLTFGNIKAIELDEKNIKSFTVYTFDGLNEKKETSHMSDLSDIKNMIYSSNDYSYYRGYTNSDIQNNDCVFQNVDRAYIDFINHLGLWILDKESPHPEVGQLVCGIVRDNRYINWFSCSEQFYLLWILIMYGENNNVFLGRNKKQILDLLETCPHLKVVGSSQEKIKNYKFNNVEPSAKLYSDIYKSIAKIFYYNEDIPIYYYIPSIGNNLMIGDIKSYKDYLLYVFG